MPPENILSDASCPAEEPAAELPATSVGITITDVPVTVMCWS